MFTQMSMTIILISIFAGPVLGGSLNEDNKYFQCYLDLCERGVQYCVERTERCHLCSSVEHLCNTSHIPRDCDSYCLGVQLNDMRMKEQATNENLNATVWKLADMTDTYNTSQDRIVQLEASVGNMTTEVLRLREIVNNTRSLEQELKVCELAKLTFSTGFIIACLVATILLLACICLAGYSGYQRCSGSSRQDKEANNDKSDESASLLSSSTPQNTHDRTSHNNEDVTNRSGNLTINGDIKVERLQLGSPNIAHVPPNTTCPPAYQTYIGQQQQQQQQHPKTFLEQCGLDVTNITKHGISETIKDSSLDILREDTPGILKNIQPTDGGNGTNSFTCFIPETCSEKDFSNVDLGNNNVESSDSSSSLVTG